MIDQREHMKKYKREYNKKWKKNNPEKVKEQKRKYRKEHLMEIKEYAVKWHENNREKHLKNMEKWRLNNLEYINKNMRNKCKTDLKYNLNNRMKVAVAISLKGNKKGRHWEDLVGYILNDLIKKLKKTMPKGYYWQDFLTGKLHIDHIIPINVFNFTKSEHIDFKRCWALKNLQLLPAKENIDKSNKLSRPFQPALKILERG